MRVPQISAAVFPPKKVPKYFPPVMAMPAPPGTAPNSRISVAHPHAAKTDCMNPATPPAPGMSAPRRAKTTNNGIDTRALIAQAYTAAPPAC